ncbi:HpcH/HpaI aldolase/citrate lyase family protein [Aurantiacibacter aquimixticola]|uniref:HpcH/HpaI aldolase/citrate lyase family protein n=1 Tax=Aurantiacibacter aquimixticola TaxID=1958945 RepID=UPI001F5BADCC|nr:CoA ester lyase [Aurantiacibacter aquimixticola]
MPGSRPDRYAKALAAGAGLTVIDLEDAVAEGDKADARQSALEAVGKGFAMRINGVLTDAGKADLAALAKADRMPRTLLVPMVESADEIAKVHRALGTKCPDLIPLIETPRGLRHALEIASADGVSAVFFGGGDFSAELGVALAWEPLLLARQQLVLACAEAGVPLIDVPFVHLDDEAGLREECERARALGFAGKAAIHPSQVAVIEEVFTPSDDQRNEAVDALQAYEDAGRQAVRHKGRMLEEPLVKHYRAVLARCEGSINA